LAVSRVISPIWIVCDYGASPGWSVETASRGGLPSLEAPPGTVVEIVQAAPKIVLVSWDSDRPPRQLTREISERLFVVPKVRPRRLVDGWAVRADSRP
jgi:hypothetical protein